jgi:hypothetical protein
MAKHIIPLKGSLIMGSKLTSLARELINNIKCTKKSNIILYFF